MRAAGLLLPDPEGVAADDLRALRARAQYRERIVLRLQHASWNEDAESRCLPCDGGGSRATTPDDPIGGWILQLDFVSRELVRIEPQLEGRVAGAWKKSSPPAPDRSPASVAPARGPSPVQLLSEVQTPPPDRVQGEAPRPPSVRGGVRSAPGRNETAGLRTPPATALPPRPAGRAMCAASMTEERTEASRSRGSLRLRVQTAGLPRGNRSRI